MSTNTRPELSEQNKWWLPKHRYYELMHFCRQYPDWQRQLLDIDGLPPSSPAGQEQISSGRTTDLTALYGEVRTWLSKRIDMIDKAAFEACDHQFWYVILIEAVTQNLSYDKLEARKGIMPVSREKWYVMYRKFFWTLDKIRE